ncbi:WYL domain-containing protein [Jannaschia formosa]|uniref:WYL domain-containing protein n=1 Tax=Jannaschia formosa TaxID=2259592 RepID=UPI0010750054|nr:WYL domain-containing protein [Jannaschia formosa]TFL16412.1 hypothetical protein DR046_20020 [Jannaschia formosa]
MTPLPIEDDPDEDDPGPVELDPIFLLIDYRDSKGQPSRRRITCRALVRSRGGHPSLRAICHERSAMRAFRLDRIEAVIDQDGTVTSILDFLDELAIDMAGIGLAAPAKPRKKATPIVDTAEDFRRAIMPSVVLLTAAGRSDHHLHDREIDAILEFIEDEWMERSDCPGPDGLDAQIESFAKAIRRLRPTTRDLDVGIEALNGANAATRDRTILALAKLVKADGVVCEAEEEFLREVGLL